MTQKLQGPFSKGIFHSFAKIIQYNCAAVVHLRRHKLWIDLFKGKSTGNHLETMIFDNDYDYSGFTRKLFHAANSNALHKNSHQWGC